jgi:hypothetical protein
MVGHRQYGALGPRVEAKLGHIHEAVYYYASKYMSRSEASPSPRSRTASASLM